MRLHSQDYKAIKPPFDRRLYGGWRIHFCFASEGQVRPQLSLCQSLLPAWHLANRNGPANAQAESLLLSTFQAKNNPVCCCPMISQKDIFLSAQLLIKKH